MTEMRDFYVNIATDLQKSLPLYVSHLMYLKCLDPANCKKAISIARICKLWHLLSHVITKQKVTLVQDQFKLLQVEQAPDSWLLEGQKVETYWYVLGQILWYPKCCRRNKVHTIVESCKELSVIAKAVYHSQMQVWIEVFQTKRTLLVLKEIISQMKVW